MHVNNKSPNVTFRSEQNKENSRWAGLGKAKATSPAVVSQGACSGAALLPLWQEHSTQRLQIEAALLCWQLPSGNQPDTALLC